MAELALDHCSALGEAGCEVKLVTTGEDLLTTLEGGRYDLVVVLGNGEDLVYEAERVCEEEGVSVIYLYTEVEPPRISGMSSVISSKFDPRSLEWKVTQRDYL